MRHLLSSLLLICTMSVWAQYNNPNRLTFDGANYYITNKGNGTIVQLDTSFLPSTVITGLYAPNDIFFGTVAGSSTLAVIDSNQVKLFNPSTFASMLNLSIQGAVEAHDGVFDPNNNNLFYISDRGGNKIIKGSIGAPPFYPITYSTLASGIPRPTGLMFDDNGRLLVVEDSTDASIHWINTSTGYDSILVTTTLDSLNDISQDLQGNYYVTCWGDNYLYRLDSNLSNPYRLVGYNKPSGMYVNTTYDYLAICCFICNKVEFKAFHMHAPAIDIATCPNDSFFASFNPVYWGIGTYNSDNRFILEVSDSSGNFTQALRVDSISSDTVPPYIHTRLPAGAYAPFGHRYRFRSTSPVSISPLNRKLDVYPQPQAFVSLDDSATICRGSSLRLGQQAVSGHRYHWSPGHTFNDSTDANPLFRAGSSGNYPIHLMEYDSSTGCSNTGQMFIKVIDRLTLDGLPDSLAMCPGDTIQVGLSNNSLFFSWSGSDSLIGTTLSNPQFHDIQDRDLIVIFSTFDLSCSGRDTVHVAMYDVPSFTVTSRTDSICLGQSYTFRGQLDSLHSYTWNGQPSIASFDTQDLNRPTWKLDTAGNYSLEASIVEQVHGCRATDRLTLEVLPPPSATGLEVDRPLLCIGTPYRLGTKLRTDYHYSWSSDHLSVEDGDSSAPLLQFTEGRDSGQLRLTFTDAYGCTDSADYWVDGFPVPDLQLSNQQFNDSFFIGLADAALAQRIESDSNLRTQWYLNDVPYNGGLDRSVFFFREEFSHGDSVNIELVIVDRYLPHDTLCSYLSPAYVKTDLGSVNALDEGFSLYPNPARTHIRIQGDHPISQIEVLDVNGRQVHASPQFGSEVELDVRMWGPGLYLLRFQSEGRWYSARFYRL